jgi:general secretion pathway protein H
MTGSRAGFTLVELLVVLLIIGVVFVAMPIAYDRMKPGLEVRSDAREIARILRETRGIAIRDNEEATVLIDLNERFLRIGAQRERFDFSEGMTLTLETAVSEQIGPDAGRIRFFPNGASTGGRVTLERLGKMYRIEVDWLFGRVRVFE